MSELTIYREIDLLSNEPPTATAKSGETWACLGSLEHWGDGAYVFEYQGRGHWTKVGWIDAADALREDPS